MLRGFIIFAFQEHILPSSDKSFIYRKAMKIDDFSEYF